LATHSDIHTPPATTHALHVLAISGSTRAGSFNAQLLRAAAAGLPPSVELVELDPALIKAIPAFDEDDEARAGGDDIPALRTMRDQIAGADAVLFATPEYNASVPGALKNALDWISRPIAANVLRNKPVAVIGASTGLFGAAWAQAELRKILQTIGAKVVDRELALGQADQQFDEGGSLLAADLHEQLVAHIFELLEAASAFRRATQTTRSRGSGSTAPLGEQVSDAIRSEF
jgi:chromate reductase, NAD(P)H dehydrogenase (quinone)